MLRLRSGDGVIWITTRIVRLTLRAGNKSVKPISG
jgi:hypothetical protein